MFNWEGDSFRFSELQRYQDRTLRAASFHRFRHFFRCQYLFLAFLLTCLFCGPGWSQTACFSGETLGPGTRGTPARFFKVDIDRARCNTGRGSPRTPPNNGFVVLIQPVGISGLFLGVFEYAGGVRQPNPDPGTSALSNYNHIDCPTIATCTTFFNNVGRLYFRSIPSTGSSSTFTFNTTIFGIRYSFIIDEIKKTEGVNSVTYGLVSIVGGNIAAGGAPGRTSGLTLEERTKRLIKNFMSRRADQITANDPDIAERLLNGGNNGGSNGNAVNVTASGTGDNNQVAMSTSLRQVAQAATANKDKRGEELTGMMGLGSQPLNGTTVSNGFDVWVEGKWVQIDSDTAESDLGLLYIGADYRFSSALVVGVLGQFDWTDEEDDVNRTDLDGRGWMVGPYVVARVHQNLIFDGRAAWGRSNNDISPDRTYSGSFDTKRWLAKGQLTGDFDYGLWHFAPHVGIIYFDEHEESYTDSDGVVIGNQTVSLGRVTFGPKVTTTFQSGAMTVSPYLGVKGVWDFDRTDTVDVSSGLAIGTDGFRGRVEGGAAITITGGGITLTGEGFYDGIGADNFDAYGGSANVSVPFN